MTIKKLKLTDVEQFKLKTAMVEMSGVLNAIKLHSLKGDALLDMKTLENSVQFLEYFVFKTCRK
jgi:hypothetical protein